MRWHFVMALPARCTCFKHKQAIYLHHALIFHRAFLQSDTMLPLTVFARKAGWEQRWSPWGQNHLPDTAMSSCDHPVWAEQRPSTEVEAIGFLEEEGFEIQSSHSGGISEKCMCFFKVNVDYLKGHLPRPGPGYCILSIHNLVVAAHLGLDGGH